MKKTTLFLMLAFMMLLSHAQINLSQDFENGQQGWDTNLYFFTQIQSCSVKSVRKDLWPGSQAGIIDSPNVVAMSNGNDITISFDYKLVNWGTATIPTPAGWGSVLLKYSTDQGSNWNTFATIDDSNHVVSNQCANVQFIISGDNVPSGSDFMYRVEALWADGDYYLYLDNIEIAQSSNQSPPTNDNSEDAIELNVNSDEESSRIDGSVMGATYDEETAACGLNGPGIWYKFTAPNSGGVLIETGVDEATSTEGFDSVIEAFRGPINNLQSIDCDDNSGDTDGYSRLNLNNLTPGEEIYVRVWENGGNEAEPFSIAAFSETLGINESEFVNEIVFHPNPVRNILNFNANMAIEHITIYNILGQEVFRGSPNSVQGMIDTSKLKSGAYLLKATANSVTKTVRIIKQ